MRDKISNNADNLKQPASLKKESNGLFASNLCYTKAAIHANIHGKFCVHTNCIWQYCSLD